MMRPRMCANRMRAWRRQRERSNNRSSGTVISCGRIYTQTRAQTAENMERTSSRTSTPILSLALFLSAHGVLGAQVRTPGAANILPPPAGPLPIGRVTYHWIDSARTDMLSKDRSVYREIMVDVWYPAASSNGLRAPYLPELARLQRVLPDSVIRSRFAPSYAA